MQKSFHFSYRQILPVCLSILGCFATNAQAAEKQEVKISSTEDFIKAFENDELIEGPRTDTEEPSLIEKKVIAEDKFIQNDWGILAHKLNYFIPVSYKSDSPTYYTSPSQQDAAADPNERNLEAMFQFSFKAALFDVSDKYKSKVFFGFTAKSFWQLYTKKSSSPFRETNYEPEIFWEFPFRIKPLDIQFLNARLGFSHESNGQNIPFSRSWNRIYASFEWEDSNWVYQFKPWYRLPEDHKRNNTQVDGDDNPDISDYMGHFQFRAVMKNHRNQLAFTIRNNLHVNDNKGAIAVDWIFPSKHQLQPYIQVFHGYGDSLIDYNQKLTRIGFGVLLSDWY
ncbi:MAG: phospholipase A [Pseudomonadota bacterium]|nr:phospholipase A [Pseudomonadota bacterium]